MVSHLSLLQGGILPVPEYLHRKDTKKFSAHPFFLSDLDSKPIRQAWRAGVAQGLVSTQDIPFLAVEKATPYPEVVNHMAVSQVQGPGSANFVVSTKHLRLVHLLGVAAGNCYACKLN